MANRIEIQLLDHFLDLDGDSLRFSETHTGLAGTTVSVLNSQGSSPALLVLEGPDPGRPARDGTVTVTAQAVDADGNNIGRPASDTFNVDVIPARLDPVLRRTIPDIRLGDGGTTRVDLDQHFDPAPQLNDYMTYSIAAVNVPSIAARIDNSNVSVAGRRISKPRFLVVTLASGMPGGSVLVTARNTYGRTLQQEVVVRRVGTAKRIPARSIGWSFALPRPSVDLDDQHFLSARSIGWRFALPDPAVKLVAVNRTAAGDVDWRFDLPQSEVARDGAIPQLRSASVAGSSLTLTYDLALDTSSVPFAEWDSGVNITSGARNYVAAAIEVAPNGRVYVADWWGDTLDTFDSNGIRQLSVPLYSPPTPGSSPATPQTMAALPNGDLVVLDVQVRRQASGLWVYDVSAGTWGDVILVPAAIRAGGFSGIAVNSSGDVEVLTSAGALFTYDVSEGTWDSGREFDGPSDYHTFNPGPISYRGGDLLFAGSVANRIPFQAAFWTRRGSSWSSFVEFPAARGGTVPDDIAATESGLVAVYNNQGGGTSQIDVYYTYAHPFVVKVDGSPVLPAAVEVSGTTVTLTLAAPVSRGQTATVSYTAGSAPIRGTSLGVASNFANRAVTNNT